MVIDNFRENSRRLTHDYQVGDLVYVEMNDIYCKLDYNKHGSDMITTVFTNVTVRVQWGQVNKHIDIRQLKPHFIEWADRLP